MAGSITEIGAKAVSDHEIHVFYESDGLNPLLGPQTTLGMLAAGERMGIPEDQAVALGGRYQGHDIWRRADDPRIGTDLHLHIQDLVNGRRDDLLARWDLGTQAKRLLTTADLFEDSVDPKDRHTKRLQIELSNAAGNRLTALGIGPSPLIVSIESLSLLLFATGHGFMDSVLTISRSDGKPLTALELLEAQIAIGRLNTTTWTDTVTGQRAGSPFTLGQLLRRLALGDRHKTKTAGRASTYTYVRFDEVIDVAARDKLALYFARHYTTDYVTAPEIAGVRRVSDFDTVRHTVALEGAATIVGPTAENPTLPNALKDFKTNAVRHHYAPLALLALHEQSFLVERTTSSMVSKTEMVEHAETTRRLREIRDAMLVFRLCFHFSEISYISMHNAFYHALRDVYNVDRMLSILDSTVAEIASHLATLSANEDRKTEHANHLRYYWASVTGGAALAGLTSYTIAKEVAEVAHLGKDCAGLIGLGGGLLVAAVAVYVMLKQRPTELTKAHPGHLTIHAMLENMIKRALK